MPTPPRPDLGPALQRILRHQQIAPPMGERAFLAGERRRYGDIIRPGVRAVFQGDPRPGRSRP